MDILLIVALSVVFIAIYFVIALVKKNIYIEKFDFEVDGQGMKFNLKTKEKNEVQPARRPRSKK